MIRDLRLRLEADRVLGLNRRLSVVVPVPDDAPVSSVAAPAGRSVTPERASGEPLATAKDTVPEDFDRPESVGSERDLRQSRLDEIAAQVRVCEECPLCESRTQTVFGVGDPAARLLFVGEGPGFDKADIPRRPTGRALRGASRSTPGSYDSGHGFEPSRGLHCQRRQVPPAAKPHPESAGDDLLSLLPGVPDRRHRAGSHCDVG